MPSVRVPLRCHDALTTEIVMRDVLRSSLHCLLVWFISS